MSQRLRRLDYNVDVNADAPVAHYTEDYKTFGGLAFPTGTASTAATPTAPPTAP